MADKKIWKIEDPEERAPVPASHPPAHHPDREKSPAAAFSLALLLWGGGQMYQRRWRSGILLFLLMANFYSALVLLAVYWEFIYQALKPYHVGQGHMFMAGGIFYGAGLILWAGSAIYAFYAIDRARIRRYQGSEYFLLAPLCGLLLPGWGQFLNGQPKKGCIFFLSGLTGTTVPLLAWGIYLWPRLETPGDRLILEQFFILALATYPLLILVWILSAYDALKISLDPFKKDPLHKRIKYAINRIRMNGWNRGVLPQAKLSLLFGLLLVLTLTLSSQYFPKREYFMLLQRIHAGLIEKELVLLPHLIHRVLHSVTFKNTG